MQYFSLKQVGVGLFEVLEDYSWKGFTIPSGFTSDGDSVPRIPIFYEVFKARTLSGAIIHDYLYTIKYPRRKADRLFLKAMKEEGVKCFYRYGIYLGVRAFGFIRYNKK